MRSRNWAVVAALIVGTGLAGSGVASAQPSAPATTTLSPEQVTKLCEKRLPKMEERIAKLAKRINGGPEVKGSAAWLKARADKERAAGRKTTAELLTERAERRAGRADDLDRLTKRVAEFKSTHCAGK